MDSTNSGVVWDNFQVFQGHRVHTPYIKIGSKPLYKGALKLEKHPNAIKQALQYQGLLDSGQVDSQTELARLTRRSRTTISAYLRLLGLTEEVRAQALEIDDDDERARFLTEPRLRGLVGLTDPSKQRQAFEDVLSSPPASKPGGRSR